MHLTNVFHVRRVLTPSTTQSGIFDRSLDMPRSVVFEVSAVFVDGDDLEGSNISFEPSVTGCSAAMAGRMDGQQL